MYREDLVQARWSHRPREPHNGLRTEFQQVIGWFRVSNDQFVPLETIHIL